MRRSWGWLAGMTLACALGAPAVATADDQLPNLDRRGAEVTRAAEAVKAAPADGLLTGPSSAAPETIALDYVRAHETTFGLDDADVDTLRLAAKAVSPDGITHLRYDQVVDGVESYDAGLSAHVTRDGRLIEVTGRAVPGATLPSTKAAVGATASLGAARDAVHGSGLAPGLTSSTHDSADFTTGESARLQWTDTAGDGPRLAWSVVADGADANVYNVLVDAGNGDVLTRTSITDDLGNANYYVKDPDYGGQVAFTMPPEWYDQSASGTRLWGMYARTYADFAGTNPVAGAEGGAGLTQIPASNAPPTASPDWLYTTSTSFAGAGPCPVSGCTWNSATNSTKTTNLDEAAVNAHILVSRYHQHLLDAPIGFDEASGNYQRVNASGAGVGGDYVQVEVDDSSQGAHQAYNNANFATPPDGTPGRMQMYLWNTFDVNGADDADVVYHEYGHGMTNRLVVNPGGGTGLTGMQSRMMGEAWSDFYALDYLQTEGYITDTAAPAEVTMGKYVVGGQGIRAKPIDCPVSPDPSNAGASPGCNGTDAAPVNGGYTYGDIANTDNSSPHNGGEVWAETLWDLRARLGSATALTLVTGGLRLSPVNPTMLDMRDAILREAVAIRSAPGAGDDYYDDVWQVFAARGFGGAASSTGGDDVNVVESYALPTGLRAGGAAAISDPYPAGDGDGLPEAGETLQISQPLTGVAIADEGGVTGALSATGGGGTVLSGSAAWPLLGYGRVGSNTAPLTVKMPSTCTAPVTFNLAATAPSSGPTLNVPISLDPRPGSQTPVAIHDNLTETSSFTAYGSGTITDADIRITALQHSYLGDLVMTVSHDGVSATLLAGNDNWNSRDLNGVVFDDQAGSGINESTNAPSPAAGHYRPDVPGGLAAFDGHPIAGTWTLTIHDNNTEDTGVLKSWGVESPQIACSPLEIPSATTDSAGALGEGTAQLAGSVNPDGRATGLRFAWGTSTAYGHATATQDAGSGTSAVSRTATLTIAGDGLVPGVTYHARAEAIRENGVVAAAGEDRTFTVVPGAPPAPPSSPPSTTTPVLPVRPGDLTAPAFTGRPKVTVARKASHRRRAATVAFALSEPAKLAVTLTRGVAGTRSGSRCVAKRRHGRSCTRYLRYGKVIVSAVKSTRSVVLKLGSLPKGRYAASLIATDAAGNRSKVVRVRFTVR